VPVNLLNFSAAQLIRNYNCGPLAAQRPMLTQNARGKWTETDTIDLTFDPVAVCPAPKGDALDPAAGEADRQKDRIRLFTTQLIQQADRVTWPLLGVDRVWRVIHVVPYDVQAGAYIAEAALIDVTA